MISRRKTPPGGGGKKLNNMHSTKSKQSDCRGWLRRWMTGKKRVKPRNFCQLKITFNFRSCYWCRAWIRDDNELRKNEREKKCATVLTWSNIISTTQSHMVVLLQCPFLGQPTEGVFESTLFTPSSSTVTSKLIQSEQHQVCHLVKKTKKKGKKKQKKISGDYNDAK